jgi:hypothetical protein
VSRICAPSACNASTASSVSGFISRARASSRVGLGRHHLDEFFLAHGLQRVVDSPFIERHRVGMSGIEPADRCCTDTREHSSVLVSRLNKFIDAQTTPYAHHLQRVSTANVDDVCRQDLFPDLLFRRLLLDQQEDVRPALQKFAEILLDTLPISFGIRTRGWDKEQLRILFVRKSDRFSIERGGSSVLISPPPMATITFCICASYFESNSGAPRGFRADDGLPFHNPLREGLPTIVSELHSSCADRFPSA